MNIEPTIQNEMSQKEKDKYHILTHTYGIQKNGTEELIYRAAMEKQDFPDGSDGKASAYKAGDPGLISGSEGPLEKGMVTHCSILAWRIPWTEEPGGPQSIGLEIAGHN